MEIKTSRTKLSTDIVIKFYRNTINYILKAKIYETIYLLMKYFKINLL